MALDDTTEAGLRALLDRARVLVGGDEGSVLLLDGEARELVFTLTVGSPRSEATLRGQRVPLGQGITGLAAATCAVQIGAPTYVDVEQSRRADGQEGQPAAVLAAPMLARTGLVGVLTTVSFAPEHAFTGAHAELYAALGAVAAGIVAGGERVELDAATVTDATAALVAALERSRG